MVALAPRTLGLHGPRAVRAAPPRRPRPAGSCLSEYELPNLIPALINRWKPSEPSELPKLTPNLRKAIVERGYAVPTLPKVPTRTLCRTHAAPTRALLPSGQPRAPVDSIVARAKSCFATNRVGLANLILKFVSHQLSPYLILRLSVS